jgi:hypothetical protein
MGIATRYGLDGLDIESLCGVRFSAVGTGSFPGVKRSGRVIDHPPPSSAEVKERVEIYISPSWP